MSTEREAQDDALIADLVRAGAREARAGLGIGIFMCAIFFVIGAVLLFSGAIDFLSGRHAVNGVDSYVAIGVGLFIVAVTSYAVARQFRLKRALEDAFERER